LPDELLLAERRGRVLLLTLNRPAQRNAFNASLSRQLAAAVDEFDADDSASVAVITGAKGTFCSGADFGAYAAGEDTYVEGRGHFGILERPPRKPLIAAVEGYAVAGGFELALACDLVVAADDASFGLTEPRYGLLAAGGGLIRLARRIPYHLAMEIALTGATFGADRAASFGIVNRVVPAGTTVTEAIRVAEAVATNAPLAVRASKELVRLASGTAERELWALQDALRASVRASADAQEGIDAFLEKRPPFWEGR
jgi:enoyl-CoA hydratase/carnithine racemase